MADKKTLELQIQVIADSASKTVKTLSSDFKNLATQVKGIDTASVSSSVKNLQGEITRAANSIKLFGSSSGEIKTMQARIKSATLDLIDGGLKPESKEIQNLIDEYKKLDAAGADLESSTGSLAGGFGNLIDQVKALAPAVAAVSFDKQLGAAAGFALEQSDNFRAMREEFGIMLGDMDAGRGLFNELQEFNFWTPFDMEQTSQATKVLMAAKVPLSEITDYLTRFGDISQGNGQKFQSFINAFSKASAKGSADMEILNVYLDQGIQILDELGKQFGVTSGEVIKMASNGQISFQQFDQALKSLAAEGGLYYGSMETASQRLDAAQAGLQESTNALAASFGDMLAPAALAVVSGITKIVDAINASPLLKGALAGIIAGVALAINAQLIKAVIALAAKMWTAYAATMAQAGAMAILNPALLGAVAAAGVATAAVVTFAAKQQLAADAVANTNLAIRKQEEKMKDLARSAKAASEEVLSASTTQLRKMADDYANQISDLKSRIADLQQTAQTSQSAYSDANILQIQSKNPVPGGFAYEGPVPNVSALRKQAKQAQTELEEAQKELIRLEGEAQAVLDRLNDMKEFTPDWQDKLLSGVEKINRERELAIQELNKKAGEILGEQFTLSPEYQKELSALNQYFDQEIKKLEPATKPAPVFDSKWTEKNLSEIDRLKNEYQKSIQELNKSASESFGDNYATRTEYTRELAALESYYQNEISRQARDIIRTEHQDKMAALQEEAEFRLAVARRNLESGTGSVFQFAVEETKSQIASTEAGSVVQSAETGGIGGVIATIIESLVGFMLAIESVNKLLNFISTTLSPMFAVLEPLIDSALEPFADFLEEIGRTAGMILAPAFNLLALAISPVSAALKILSPVLQAVAKVFEWLNNYVIVPIGNAFIDVINAVIGLLNKIPFVNIKKLDRLNVIGEKADEMAEEFEKYTDLLNSKFERQKSAVEEMLQSQLDALQSQYELGLISREEYESEAQKYQSTADEKLYEINKQQKEVLDMINDNTYNMLSEDAKKAVESERTSYAQKWGEKVPVLGHLAGGTVDVVTTVVDTVVSAGKAVGGFFKKLFTWSWDVGTPNIPFDHLAMVHQGETIIPRTFAEGIRSGELSLVGGKGSASSGQPVYISISVAGSVVTENELVDVIYNGIARGIRSGAKNPLPQGA